MSWAGSAAKWIGKGFVALFKSETARQVLIEVVTDRLVRDNPNAKTQNQNAERGDR